MDHVDLRHGLSVPDPYRWLEDLGSPEVAAWVRAQNAVTEAALARVPGRARLRERMRALLDYEKIGAPVTRNGRAFALWNDGLRDQLMLCLLRDDGDPQVLVDPNEWSDDGTVALTAFAPSPDGALVAYGVARAGSDWNEWRILDVETSRVLEDRIERIRFSAPSWSIDGRGLYHAAFDADDVTRVRYHRLGTDQRDDELVYERADRPTLRFQPVVSEDGRWLVIYAFDQTGGPNGIACIDLARDRLLELPNAFEGRFSFVANDGPLLWFVTDLGAPRRRLVSIDLDAQTPSWGEVVPEASDALEWVLLKEHTFLAGYNTDATTSVRLFARDGTPAGEVELPGVGWAGGFDGPRDDPETHFLFMSFTQPPALYAYDVRGGRARRARTPALPFDPSELNTARAFYHSADGTRVPIFVTHRHDLARDGNRPTLLWGYGGFGIPVVAWFWPLAIAWVERGGVFATAMIRGGGEYGEEWHRGGSGENKTNSFDDFIAAAEWLIQQRYTNERRLAISGASNGGLLVGACITRRPDLFAAAHIDMGLLDMLNLDRVQIGLALSAEYGSLDDADDFRRIRGYSPLHNVDGDTQYPPVLLTTGDHDELVLPSNSYKFAATMQASASDAPVLLRVETDTGHGVGKSTAKTLAEQSDILTFLLAAVGEA